jgi:hypothetical protein
MSGPSIVAHDRIPIGGPITQTLIGLAHVSKAHRVLATGSISTEILLELHRRGCTRVAATGSCGLPRGQYDAALVGWRAHSIKALETTLNWLVHYLRPDGVLAVWVSRDEGAPERKLRLMLQRLGFRVEAGTTCENGLAVVARRLGWAPAAMAAA